MRFMHRCFLLAVALLATSTAFGICSEITKPVTKGVTLTQIFSDNPVYPLVTNVLSVDFNRSDLVFRPVLGRGVVYTDDQYIGKENVASMVERTGAVAGVNSDFFSIEWGGDPLGVCIIDGELVSEPGGMAGVAFTKDRKVVFDRAWFAASLKLADGSAVKLSGINRPLWSDEIVAYTSAFGPKIKNESPVPYIRCKASNLPVRVGKNINLTVVDITTSKDASIESGTVILSGGEILSELIKNKIRVGDKLSMRFDLKSKVGFDWRKAWQASSGGPYLVKNGFEAVDMTDEGLQRDLGGRHPRTAIGVTRDNKVLMVTVDGRQDISKGITLYDLATMMRKMGAVNAINLDGGGSSDLAIRGAVINSPSDGHERQVANGLLLFSKKKPKSGNGLYSISGISDTIEVGQTVNLSLVKGPGVKSVRNPKNVIWGSTSGTGFVDQNGMFTAKKSGKGSICAVYGGVLVTKPVQIIGKSLNNFEDD